MIGAGLGLSKHTILVRTETLRCNVPTVAGHFAEKRKKPYFAAMLSSAKLLAATCGIGLLGLMNGLIIRRVPLSYVK